MKSVDVQHGTREAHLRDYWRIVWAGRYTVLAVFLVVVGVTMLRVALATPIYEATAVLEIKPEARRIIPGQDQWVGSEGRSWIAEEAYFNTQLEILKSRDLAETVFHQLHLTDHPRFEEVSDPIGVFAAMVKVKPKVNTRLVEVSISGPDPKECREWVNALTEAYVTRNVEEAAESFHTIMDEIKRGLATFRDNMSRADTERLRTAADQELYDPESQQEVLRKNLQTYNDELARLTVELGSLEGEIERLSTGLDEGEEFMALPRFFQDPVVQSLNTQKLGIEAEIERLATEKQPQHPDVVAKKRELQAINQNIRSQADRIVGELRTRHRLLKSNVAHLQERIRDTEEQGYRIAQASTTYGIQKTDAETKRKVYDVVAETMERLSVGAQLVYMNNNVTILDHATEPQHSVAPRKKAALAFSTVIGLLLGVGAVLFLDYLDNTLRTPEDIEQYLGLGVVAIIPKFRDPKADIVREAMQSLRTSILFSSNNREKNVILFTSAGPQEGKSTTTSLMGKTMASGGDRVVIVDCDLRRPTQHSGFGLSREPGVTNYLIDGKEGEYEPFIRAVNPPNLHVLTCGPIPPNPPELIGTARFRRMIEGLKRDYDWVIIDSPPVANLADTVVLSSLVDMLIVLIKSNENDRELIRRSLKRLRERHVNVIGAVLNGLDLERSYYSAYSYMYYGREDARETGKRRLRRSRGHGTPKSKDVAL